MPGVMFFYAHDALKNVSALYNEFGNILAFYQCNPLGSPTHCEDDIAAVNPFRFSSEYHDDELGLIYYNFRHYNPIDGRWINRDPIAEEGGLNLYGFVGNAPGYLSDGLGLSSSEYRGCAPNGMMLHPSAYGTTEPKKESAYPSYVLDFFKKNCKCIKYYAEKNGVSPEAICFVNWR